ncbi:MAG: hypothetical protein A3J69_01130 [Candidatus Levybacteria bacterium RIFCSPHIGHO2_02_FULL_42_12]|nr:MAG: hypothetical protein A2698_01695 [Candidatus Levybacteria bacterium RIFCSPHIGHO2_01_FULL_42_15]OGH33878.1 MAG: hypothetical protein A3J69_01130 [Candidatus Levybacteria bacterium RIFCSPHIGHO2_02_FULL_42_12]OGH43029.1 MAG: hypothetical protein A3B53_00150 [Candidatus Levybacteria bacterium RIFCSPLOWO2_01_FULL_42_15]
MARRKKEEIIQEQSLTQQEPVLASSQNEVMDILKKREFILGLATVLILLGGALFAYGWNSYQKGIKESKNLLSSQTEQKMEEQKEDHEKTDNDLSQVTKLADTSFALVVIQEGDSYARIARKLCGSEKPVERLLEMNANKTLKAGDILKVDCSE